MDTERLVNGEAIDHNDLQRKCTDFVAALPYQMTSTVLLLIIIIIIIIMPTISKF